MLHWSCVTLLQCSQLKLGTFWFLTTQRPLLGLSPRFPPFLVWKASLTYFTLTNWFKYFLSNWISQTSVTFKVFIVEISFFRQNGLEFNFPSIIGILIFPCKPPTLHERVSYFQLLNISFVKLCVLATREISYSLCQVPPCKIQNEINKSKWKYWIFISCIIA